MDLKKRKCLPCEGGVLPMKNGEIKEYQELLKSPWPVIDGKMIAKEFKLKNFKEAIAFINQVAEIAETEQHHPDIHVFYNKVTIELWTHAINGLSENDFILAAKIDELI